MFPNFQKNKVFTGEVTMDKLNAIAAGAARGVASVSGNITMTQGPGGVALHVPQKPHAVEITPFFVSAPYDSGGWKVKVSIGTLNGQTPVVGNVTGSGGSAMTASTVLDLSAGEPWVCLGVKTNLETREILRLTLQTVEDLIPVVDTGARTRITYIPLAELTEGGTPEWVKAVQVATTNLSYFTSGNSDFVWRS